MILEVRVYNKVIKEVCQIFEVKLMYTFLDDIGLTEDFDIYVGEKNKSEDEIRLECFCIVVAKYAFENKDSKDILERFINIESPLHLAENIYNYIIKRSIYTELNTDI